MTMINPNPGVIYWFRHDLRLHDAPALGAAIQQAAKLGTWLLPVYVHDECLNQCTPWGFKRMGPNRQAWVHQAVAQLSQQLTAVGSALIQAEGNPVHWLKQAWDVLGHPLLICEEIAAPEEQAQIEALRRQGIHITTHWQATLMSPESLPFLPEAVPDRFTSFREQLERHGVRPALPEPKIQQLPNLPPPHLMQACRKLWAHPSPSPAARPGPLDTRAAFPWDQAAFAAGEDAALAHLEQYCRRKLPHSYQSTRNQLLGVDYSSKWSPWLATGALSPRTAWARVSAFESEYGASESSYWLLFELLWRDHFRWLHRKHGKKLYSGQGLSQLPSPSHDPLAFQQWCRGETGNAWIDAGMNELATSGYLSNRMRQNVASFLIHDLACDWRAGAAWFESNLIDYDVYNNQGNWLYLSGRGTDPRPNRRFNPQLQASHYDPDGNYRRLWARDGCHGKLYCMNEQY